MTAPACVCSSTSLTVRAAARFALTSLAAAAVTEAVDDAGVDEPGIE